MRLIPTSITQRTVDPNDPTGGMTIDALRARQLALQDQMPKAPAQIASPWQGAAFMADRLVNNIQQKQAAAEEAAGRQKLAQIMGGINYDTGATPQQIAQLETLDPDLGTRMVADAIRARRELAQQAHQDAMTREGWGHEDKTLANRQAFETQQATNAQEHADLSQQRTFEQQDKTNAGNQDFQRQQAADARTAATESQQAGFAHSDQAAATAREYQAGLPQTETAKLDADLKAGRITQEEHDAAIAKGQPETYGDIVTGDAAKALGLDPSKQWQQNLKTKKWEMPGGGGINIQTVPSEVGARVALGDDFLSNIDEVRRSAAAGEMTGPLDYSSSVLMGRGTGGNAYRMLVQGSEALVRQLTGAGKSQSEAQSQAAQFLPTITDNAETLTAKVDSLGRQLRATRVGSTAGRNFPAAPAEASATAAATALPKGVTEDDVQTTMRANNMTREQVLNRLAGGANGRP